MHVAIVIPVYHSSDILLDFTKQTLESIKSDNHELTIYLIVNYSLPLFYPKREFFTLHSSIKELRVIDNPLGNHVGSSWNLGIKTGLSDQNDFVVVMNNDLILHPFCIDNLVKFGKEHFEFILWSAAEWLGKKTLFEATLDEIFSEHPHFSLFMISQKTIDIVGWFDEKLKMGYMEDGDMHYRILLSGNKAGKTETAKFYHYGSRTIKVDDELFDRNKRTYEDNREYIKKKWNVDFHNKVYDPPEDILKEGYKYPFNDQFKSLKDW